MTFSSFTEMLLTEMLARSLCSILKDLDNHQRPKEIFLLLFFQGNALKRGEEGSLPFGNKSI
jgi:hypothetical protein